MRLNCEHYLPTIFNVYKATAQSDQVTKSFAPRFVTIFPTTNCKACKVRVITGTTFTLAYALTQPIHNHYVKRQRKLARRNYLSSFVARREFISAS